MIPSRVMLILLDEAQREVTPHPAQSLATRVLRRAQLASLLGVSASTLVRMLTSGHMPVAPLPWPGHPRWSRAAVANWLGGADDLPDASFRLLTVPEVAEHLGISRSSAYRALPTWVASGQAVRCVSDWRIPLARLARLLEHA